MPFTCKQRIYLLERYLATKSYVDTIAAFTAEYEDAQVPNKSSISRLVKKFCETGSAMNTQKNRKRTVLTPEKVKEIGAAFSGLRTLRFVRLRGERGPASSPHTAPHGY